MSKKESCTTIPLSVMTSRFPDSATRRAMETALAADDRLVIIKGLAGSAISMLMTSIQPGKHPSLVITEDADSAGYMYTDLVALNSAEEVAIFPSGYRRDIKYGQPDAPSQILRTEALSAIDNKETRWVVTSPEAIAEKVPPRQNLRQSSLTLVRHKDYLMKDVRNRLLELGFTPVDYVYEPGQFAVRGSILDVFSYSDETPYRIDFFDTEIDTIRSFDIETQLSNAEHDKVTIIPAPVNLNQSDGISLLEYIPDDTVIYCQSIDWMLQQIERISTTKLATEVAITGEGDPDALRNIVSPDQFRLCLQQFKIVEYGHIGSEKDITQPHLSITLECSPQALYHKNFELISQSFNQFADDGYNIYILSDSETQAERLRAIFSERKEQITFTAVQHTLHGGFIDHRGKNCYFTDHQIFDRFHKYNLRSDKARNGKLALSLKELNALKPGDYVVHTDHGIGRFAGLVRTDVSGKTQEMIKLYYTNDDIIFVSIHSLHKLSKYRGAEGVPPKLSKLGSGAWMKLKQRTKNKVKDIARDLIRLYAERRKEKGFAYSPDTYMQHELEAGFIYEDTPDQLKAVQAIKTDMESHRPMDRLVCGDVGFGKTEIAIRAAFKAAADNKQTAVMVPTTVLALQHYRTFSHRLKDMPVRVEFLSRAKKPKEVKQILADLAEGKIDILIGTHKIIGKSVKFKDLGLLIIDEEQKFGVAVKEKLKQMKVNVDTLTMSATPIPRTLQFSLMGARDLSNLNTPPANRRPVATTIATLADDTVAEALKFELSRNGQAFFISNRIERLDILENMVRRLIPDIRIIKAHGRMSPEYLEKAITDFSNHDYDLLLATTIIENGIDMPNVNTILVDNAQNFGLSELHQLRGRVGRSDRKAFAYFLIPSDEILTPVSRRRLQAIESFSDLGVGIHIAMQDLDIRGAGNLLGAEQSGFIADLGYETYQKILKESVTELRTEEFAEEFAEDATAQTEFVADCTIESDMELRIPEQYVPQESERITLYRCLDGMDNEEQTQDFRSMLRDRFGNIPKVTEQLIDIVPLRSIARRLGIERINLKDSTMRLYFVDAANKAYYNSNAFGRILTYFQRNPRRAHLQEKSGRRSMIIKDIPTVSEALSTLRQIPDLPVS